jgi:hypothetical protein
MQVHHITTPFPPYVMHTPAVSTADPDYRKQQLQHWNTSIFVVLYFSLQLKHERERG